MVGHTLHAVAIVAIVVGFVWLVARDSARLNEDRHGPPARDSDDDRGGEGSGAESLSDPVESGPPGEAARQ